MRLTHESHDGIKILRIAGIFGGRDTCRVREWLDAAVHEDTPNIIVNLEEVDSIDSTALSILLYGLKESRKHNGNLFLCGLQQNMRILFEMTRMTRVFTILLEEQEALQEFKTA